MEPEEEIDLFNDDLGKTLERMQQTLYTARRELHGDELQEDTIQQLNEAYRDLSRMRVTFAPEKGSNSYTEPLEPLKQPTRKDHEGERGLEALEPDLLEHKQELQRHKEGAMRAAEQLYQEYRRQEGLEPVERKIDIPSTLEELEQEGDEANIHVNTLKNYLHQLEQVRDGEKTREETDYHVPENQELLQDQIERASREVYSTWQELAKKKQRADEALRELEERKHRDPIELSVRYGIRPLERTIHRRQGQLGEIETDLHNLKNTAREHLDDTYQQKIAETSL